MMKNNEDPNLSRWLTAEDFKMINGEHIKDAVHALIAGEGDHLFGESTAYDVLLENGKRLAPKAVLGIAAKRALKLDVQPSNFRGGEGSACFKTIRRLGYSIVPKGGDDKVPLEPDQSKWIEGDPVRESHLRLERNPKAVEEKKKAVKRDNNGRLICEKCRLDPVKHYEKKSGDACIEVHHIVPLAEVGRQETTIEHLMCVCANCHRILHHEMRLANA